MLRRKWSVLQSCWGRVDKVIALDFLGPSTGGAPIAGHALHILAEYELFQTTLHDTPMSPKPPTVKELANDLQVSRQSLYDWAREGCPVHLGRQAIIDWHHQHKRTLRWPVRRSKLLIAPSQTQRQEHEQAPIWRSTAHLVGDIDDLAAEIKAAGDSPDRVFRLDERLKSIMYCLWIRLSRQRALRHIPDDLSDDEVERANKEVYLQFDTWFWAGVSEDEPQEQSGME